MNDLARKRASQCLVALSILLLSACTSPTELPSESADALDAEVARDAEADVSTSDEGGSAADAVDSAPSAEASEAAAAPEAVAEAVPDVCPEPDSGSRQFVNFDEGYCLNYPAVLTVNRPERSTGLHIITILRPPANPYQTESNEPSLSIEMIEVDPEADLATLVDERLSDYAAIGGDLVRSETTIAGFPAVVVDGIPGMWTNRHAYLLNGDTLIKLLIFPWQDASLADKQGESDRLWQTVAGSLTFFGTDEASSPSESDVADPSAERSDGPLSVSEVLNAGPDATWATGFIVEREDQPRLCDALAESFPPQCGGSSMPLDGIDLGALEGVQTEGAVRWTDEAVEIKGKLRYGRFVVGEIGGR